MLLVVRTLSQITVLGSDMKTCAELWKKKIQHIPHMGATLFFQYDMKVTSYLRKRIKHNRWQELHILAAVQLQSHLFTGLRSSQVNFIIDNSGVKNAPHSTKMNKWYTVSAWINFFEEGKPFYVLAVNGEMLKQEPMKSIVNRTAADVNIYGGSLVPDEAEGSCEVRSISIYGPNRINIQKAEVVPNSKDGETIIVSTEFVSSGVDVYEVRAINPKKPLELSTFLKLSSRVKNEGIQKDVDLVEIANTMGMSVALKHRAFSREDVTVKQLYEIPVKVGRGRRGLNLIFPFLIEYRNGLNSGGKKCRKSDLLPKFLSVEIFVRRNLVHAFFISNTFFGSGSNFA